MPKVYQLGIRHGGAAGVAAGGGGGGAAGGYHGGGNSNTPGQHYDLRTGKYVGAPRTPQEVSTTQCVLTNNENVLYILYCIEVTRRTNPTETRSKQLH
jgi:hypothetical protein